MKTISRTAALLAMLTALGSPLAAAGGGYGKILKRWTRHATVYSWDNFEARLIWHATFFSDEFRRAREEEIWRLMEVREPQEDGRHDLFFVGIYAGSSQWPEVGRDDGRWSAVLETGGSVAEAVRFERIPVGETERLFFPYLDRWSRAYWVAFPKAIRPGEPFSLRLTGLPGDGLPAKSGLLWK